MGFCVSLMSKFKYCNLFLFFFPFSAQREEGRLNNEIKRVHNEIKDLTEKRNILEVSNSPVNIDLSPNQSGCLAFFATFITVSA